VSFACARAAASLVSLASLAALVTGCGAAAHSRAAGAVAPLAIHEVPWNQSGSAVAIGPLRAVVDSGTRVALFGASGMVLFAGGAPVLTDRSVVDWKGGAVVRGPEGAPVLVGVDGAGRVLALRALARFEDVSARYALDGLRVRAAVALDASRVGFLSDGAVTIVDGPHSRRFAEESALRPSSLAGGGGFGAVVSAGGLRLFDASSLEAHRYALAGITAATLGDDGHLYVMTPRALYAEQPAGDLALVFDARADVLHGLVASGKRVWFGDGDRLGVVDGDHVAEAERVISPEAKLAASPSGDVWVIDRESARRFSVDTGGAADAWAATLAPIFARACASCHRPGGVSGTDLSSVDAWRAERAAIEERVVIQHQMPPEGHPISDADRQVIHAWAHGPSN
jgi:mono/diheme cytochrome c family protein